MRNQKITAADCKPEATYDKNALKALKSEYRQQCREARKNFVELKLRYQGAPEGEKPLYTRGEELFNAITHGVGAVTAVAILVMLVIRAMNDGVAAVAGAAVFGSTLILLYNMSTLYHSFTSYRVKKVFRIFDHCSIFLLIAGTSTPYCLIGLGGSLGYWILALEWGAAAAGIALNAVSIKKFAALSMVVYLAMGWAIVLTYSPLKATLPLLSLQFLFYGGIAYTLGLLFYGLGKIKKNVKYHHGVWHLFVLAGSILHVISIWQMI